METKGIGVIGKKYSYRRLLNTLSGPLVIKQRNVNASSNSGYDGLMPPLTLDMKG